jgi:hypothetical protein
MRGVARRPSSRVEGAAFASTADASPARTLMQASEPATTSR